MLLHADRGDLVIGTLNLKHVAELDDHAVLQAEPTDFFIGEGDLLLRQGDAAGFHAVMLRGVAGQRAPAAAHVEQGVAWLEAQAATNHLQLVELGLVQGIAPVGEVRTGVDHVRVEPERVKRVRNVVVIGDIRLVFLGAAVAGLILADGFQRPGAAARQKHKPPQQVEDRALAQFLPEQAGSDLGATGHEIENRAIDDIDPRGRPEVGERVSPWAPKHRGDHVFVGDSHRQRARRVS